MPKEQSPKPTRICKLCQTIFEFRKDKNPIFCSWECFSKTARTIERQCKSCGKSKLLTQGEIDDGQGSFCSMQCIKDWNSFPRRFWRYVNKTDSCWIWIGAKSRGYGYCKDGNGKHKAAQRIAWELIRGPIPAGLLVCHDCPGGDNPACVNPWHMFLGTSLDNVLDCVKKDRHARGERATGVKLTAAQVYEIRSLFGIHKQRSIAKMFQMSEQAISGIKHRRAWKHLP